MAASPNLFLALVAGLASFISPCCLPLYPSYLSYISGVPADQMDSMGAASRRRVLSHAIAFVLGFSVVFVALGLSASLLGQFFLTYKDVLRRVGGIVVIVLGLSMLGVLRIPLLQREARLRLANRPAGFLGSALVGLSFAAGWTPCIGPILGSILVLAAANPGSGGLLMAAYSLGFAVPFLILAYAIGSLKFFRRYARQVNIVAGVLLVVVGTLLFMGWMTRITTFLIGLYGGFTGF